MIDMMLVTIIFIYSHIIYRRGYSKCHSRKNQDLAVLLRIINTNTTTLKAVHPNLIFQILSTINLLIINPVLLNPILLNSTCLDHLSETPDLVVIKLVHSVIPLLGLMKYKIFSFCTSYLYHV